VADPDTPGEAILDGRCTFVRPDGARCNAYRARPGVLCWGHLRGRGGDSRRRPPPTPTSLIQRILVQYSRELRTLRGDVSGAAKARRTEMMGQLIELEYSRNRLVIEAIKVRKYLNNKDEFERVTAAVAGTGETDGH
jgi:hypothetical protein